MAGEYYTLQEVLQKLALTEDQVNNLVREGRIREFRIEGQVQYKVSEIDELAAEINPSVVSASDSSATDSGSESAIELLPVDSTDGGTDVVSLDESGEQAPTVTPSKEDTVITPAGVSVFDEDELAGLDADPMAKTQIAPSVTDELSLEGGGSGSGLLDLTRESDDTSLGAELLDEIYSGEETMPQEQAPVAVEEAAPEGFEGVEEPAPAAASAVRAVAVQMIDPLAAVFTGLLVAAAVLLGFSGLVAVSLTMGVLPSFIGKLAENILFTLIGAVVIVVAGLVVGLISAKSRA